MTKPLCQYCNLRRAVGVVYYHLRFCYPCYNKRNFDINSVIWFDNIDMSDQVETVKEPVAFRFETKKWFNVITLEEIPFTNLEDGSKTKRVIDLKPPIKIDFDELMEYWGDC